MIVTTVYVVFSIGVMLGQSGLDESAVEQVPFLEAGFKAEREKLRQYSFRADWKQVTAKQGRMPSTVSSTIQCWADDNAGLFRFDRRDVSETSDGEQLVARTIERKFAKTADRTIHCENDGGHPGVISIEAATAASHFAIFDIRNLGIAMPQELRLAYDEHSEFFWRAQSITNVEKVSNGQVCVSFASGSPPSLQRKVWFEESKGFSPQRFECSSRDGNSWSAARFVVTFRWESLDGIWVPIEMVSKDVLGKKDVTLTIEWLNVNKPLDPRLFDYEQFDVEKGTYIADTRLNQPILLDIVGKDSPPIAPLPEAGNSLLAPLGIAALCFVLLIALVLLRRKRSHV